MKQFNLEEWLKDKSRKVVTRRGNPVRILCTDRKHGEDTLPIVFLEESPDGIGEFLLSCRADGTCDNYDTPYDLFFADEEDELTEFEKVLKEVIEDVQNGDYIEEESFDFWKGKLLNLARKEIKGILTTDAYNQGRKDALKDLPKWKRVPKIWKVEDNAKVVFSEDYKYYIDKKELFHKLQKE